jgi:hypothetical protein
MHGAPLRRSPPDAAQRSAAHLTSARYGSTRTTRRRLPRRAEQATMLLEESLERMCYRSAPHRLRPCAAVIDEATRCSPIRMTSITLRKPAPGNRLRRSRRWSFSSSSRAALWTSGVVLERGCPSSRRSELPTYLASMANTSIHLNWKSRQRVFLCAIWRVVSISIGGSIWLFAWKSRSTFQRTAPNDL